MLNETFDYVKYLDVKKDIDDRCLNKLVWNNFTHWLMAKNQLGTELRVLEIGAGIGTMIERLLEASLLRQCHYIALEPESSFREATQNRLSAWANAYGVDFEICTENIWLLSSKDLDLTIEWLAAEADKIDQLFASESFDLLLSHAVIDLLPVPTLMPVLLSKLKQDAGFYFSLNFSGETSFFPADPSDDAISNNYHNDMDARFLELAWQPSLTGKLLPQWLQDYGCQKVIAGESDWNLSDKNQTAGDGLFIKNILDTIKKALAGMPSLEDWLNKRYEQLAQQELEITISNSDCFGLK